MMNQAQILASVPKTNQNGDCFSTHLEKLVFLNVENPDKTSQYELVHGIAMGSGPIEGIRHSHCWLESKVLVNGVEFVMAHDFSNGKNVSIPAALFYLIGSINQDDCVRYTYKEAAVKAMETGHYGPWHDLPEDVL